MSSKPSRSGPILFAIKGILVTAVVLWLYGCKEESYIEGRVEMRELNIATKYPGRLARLNIEEGQRVRKGALLAEISDPEAQARLMQANAMVEGAAAQQSKADKGARPEEVESARAAMDATQAQAELARVTAGRMRRLFDQGVIPRQRLDEAIAAQRSTWSVYQASKADYEMVVAGLRPQDKVTAAAVTKEAKGERQLVESAVSEQQVYALADGEITSINFREGEIVAAGIPIAILAKTDAPWVRFNVREDLLDGLQVGDRLSAKIPALGESGTDVKLVVYQISVLGDFATWTSTRALGSYDLRTFEVRARPISSIAGLRAGMTVLVPQSEVRSEK
ncbi:HlyD family secretion protein [Microbulbifer celer]|uniref:HlyD family secretion protein n=1 Tax=Microbulbifer celer TaxID=435905 RepID=A0ABW3U526_9GAMM|nr:biotin/lipoyl-binding protein [Microbulbifer celer]UFN56633.1 biotin/lipoyl-binding protein [Microbulbifer celer]